MTRILIHLPDELLERVTDWQHHYRLPSRAEAVREMLAVGVAALDERVREARRAAGRKSRKLQEVGS
jgi:metal-responsive CopG/Arc/MetJ family transcriptional regulator